MTGVGRHKEPICRTLSRRCRWSSVLLHPYRVLADQLEDPPVLVDLVRLLEVQGAHMGLQVHHVRVLGVVEIQDPKRPGHRGVGTHRPGQHPDLISTLSRCATRRRCSIWALSPASPPTDRVSAPSPSTVTTCGAGVRANNAFCRCMRSFTWRSAASMSAGCSAPNTARAYCSDCNSPGTTSPS